MSFQRKAEGLTVNVSDPYPRHVRITDDRDVESLTLSISFEQAEGLLYALTAAVSDAKADDERRAIASRQRA